MLAFYPDKPQPYLKMAAAFEAEEAWAGAEKAITAALARTEKKGMIYYRLALAQSRQKKTGRRHPEYPARHRRPRDQPRTAHRSQE